MASLINYLKRKMRPWRKCMAASNTSSANQSGNHSLSILSSRLSTATSRSRSRERGRRGHNTSSNNQVPFGINNITITKGKVASLKRSSKLRLFNTHGKLIKQKSAPESYSPKQTATAAAVENQSNVGTVATTRRASQPMCNTPVSSNMHSISMTSISREPDTTSQTNQSMCSLTSSRRLRRLSSRKLSDDLENESTNVPRMSVNCTPSPSGPNTSPNTNFSLSMYSGSQAQISSSYHSQKQTSDVETYEEIKMHVAGNRVNNTTKTATTTTTTNNNNNNKLHFIGIGNANINNVGVGIGGSGGQQQSSTPFNTSPSSKTMPIRSSKLVLLPPSVNDAETMMTTPSSGNSSDQQHHYNSQLSQSSLKTPQISSIEIMHGCSSLHNVAEPITTSGFTKNKKCRRSNTTYTINGIVSSSAASKTGNKYEINEIRKNRIISYFNQMELKKSRPGIQKAISGENFARRVSHQQHEHELNKDNANDFKMSENNESRNDLEDELEKIQDAFFTDESSYLNNSIDDDRSSKKKANVQTATTYAARANSIDIRSTHVSDLSAIRGDTGSFGEEASKHKVTNNLTTTKPMLTTTITLKKSDDTDKTPAKFNNETHLIENNGSVEKMRRSMSMPGLNEQNSTIYSNLSKISMIHGIEEETTTAMTTTTTTTTSSMASRNAINESSNMLLLMHNNKKTSSSNPMFFDAATQDDQQAMVKETNRSRSKRRQLEFGDDNRSQSRTSSTTSRQAFVRGEPNTRMSKNIKNMFKSVVKYQMNALNCLEKFYESQINKLEIDRSRNLAMNPKKADKINAYFDEQLKLLEKRVHMNLNHICQNKMNENRSVNGSGTGLDTAGLGVNHLKPPESSTYLKRTMRGQQTSQQVRQQEKIISAKIAQLLLLKQLNEPKIRRPRTKSMSGLQFNIDVLDDHDAKLKDACAVPSSTSSSSRMDDFYDDDELFYDNDAIEKMNFEHDYEEIKVDGGNVNENLFDLPSDFVMKRHLSLPFERCSGHKRFKRNQQEDNEIVPDRQVAQLKPPKAANTSSVVKQQQQQQQQQPQQLNASTTTATLAAALKVANSTSTRTSKFSSLAYSTSRVKYFKKSTTINDTSMEQSSVMDTNRSAMTKSLSQHAHMHHYLKNKFQQQQQVKANEKSESLTSLLKVYEKLNSEMAASNRRQHQQAQLLSSFAQIKRLNRSPSNNEMKRRESGSSFGKSMLEITSSPNSFKRHSSQFHIRNGYVAKKETEV